MKRIAALLLAIAPAFAQNNGALVPVPRQQPLSNSGLILSGSCMYTYQAGSTTPAYTYSNPDLAVGHRNENPMVLDSSGRMPAVYLDAASYKFVFAQRLLGACPGSPGTVIWSQDSVYDFGQLLKAALAATTGASLIGFEPTGGTVPMTVAGALNSFLLDAGYSTFAQACAAAGSTKTLLITTLWAVPAGTYDCNLWFLQGGKLRIAASATAATTGNMTCPTYQQCFDTTTNTGALITFTKPPSNLGPVQFGADSTGVADSLAAFNAAYASSSNLYLPLGTYALSGEFSITRPGSSFHCEGTKPGTSATGKDTIIQYTGASLIRSVFRVTAGGGGDDLIENCYIKGNTHSTYAFFIDAPNGSVFRNLRVDGGITASVLHDTGVANFIDGIAIQPRVNFPTYSLMITGSNDLQINSPNIDGNTTGTGIYNTSSFTSVHAGTVEGNAVNIYNGVNSEISTYSMDNEAAGTYGLDDHGTSNLYSGLYGGITHYASTAINSQVMGSSLDQVTIDAGARWTSVIGNTYANLFGAITDNGTCSYLIRNREATGGGSIPDKFGCSGLDFGGGVNVIYDSNTYFPTSADNAIVGSFTPARGEGSRITRFFPIMPLADGMLFNIQLGHNLQVGVNTFDFLDGTGPHQIKKASNPTQNSARAYGVGAIIMLRWDADGGVFVDLGQ